MNRRQFVRYAASSSLLWLAGCRSPGLVAAGPAGTPVLATSEPFPGGRLAESLRFMDGDGKPVHQRFGHGLNARLYTDLSILDPDHAVTPTEHFYVVAAVPSTPRGVQAPWTVHVHGLVRQPGPVTMETLLKQTQAQGLHLMECSGNGRLTGFRLLSAGAWTGVPIMDLLAPLGCDPKARVRVAGFETCPPGWKDDVAEIAASWIFSVDDVAQSGAFLATHLNGQPLTMDHGQPVRLIVPGWYGCVNIKWVNEIELVADTATASPHMQSYAPVTFQNGVPTLARDYRPAIMETVAIPIRVERWQVGARTTYRLVGLVWGGLRPVHQLTIRFHGDEDFHPVDCYLPPDDTRTWAFWYHRFEPTTTGLYRIQLSVWDDKMQTRRLDGGYCTRLVHITQVSG